jgi:hypothetical protein
MNSQTIMPASNGGAPWRTLPCDIDLSGMDYMPLYLPRLMKSKAWLRAKHWTAPGPGLGFAMVNLWARAFTERPAGSIDDDDDVLMDAAMVGPRDWPAIREAALKGWVQCGDRLHHPVVCELVWNVWKTRLEARYAATLESWRAASRRAETRHREAPAAIGSFREWLAREYPATERYWTADKAPVSADLARESGDRARMSPDELDLPPDERCLSGDGTATSRASPATKGESPPDKSPKERKGKVTTPPVGPPPPCGEVAPDADGGAPRGNAEGVGKGRRRYRARGSGKDWYDAELQRLRREFGEAGEALIRLLGGGRGAGFGAVEFVKIFKGTRLHPGVRDVPATVRAPDLRGEKRAAARGDVLDAVFGPGRWAIGRML